MNYEKPEVNLLDSAVACIQHPCDKSEHDVADCDPFNPVLASVNAYAADE